MDTAPSLSLSLPAHPSPLKHKKPPPPPQFADPDDDHPPTPASHPCPPQTSPTPPARSSITTPLQRRHRLQSIARRSAGPRKRRRCAQPVENGLLPDAQAADTQTSTRPSPNAHSSPETMDICPPPLLPPVPPPPKHNFHPQNLNGSFDYLASPHRKQLYHRSLWRQIASAHHYLTGHPRTDPRFISNKRPLDCLEHLRASIFVTLLPDGYVRQDSVYSTLELPPSSPMATIQSPSPDVSASSRHPPPSPNKPTSNSKIHNITTQPRFPYDRNSKHFLRCLDLGIIPPVEDLPEMSQRYYYNGCLIADINDLRNCLLSQSKPPPSNMTRVLLRPDMASLYQDLEQETSSLDPVVARAVERIIVNTASGSIDLRPRPQLTSYTRNCAVHKLTHAFNIIRKPRTHAVRRLPGLAHVPRPTSTAALLLISAAEKQQNLQRQTSLAMRAMALELSTAATKQSSYTPSAPNSISIPNPSASRPNSEPAAANGIKPGEPKVAINRNPNKPARPWRFIMPSRALLQSANRQALKSDKAVGLFSQSSIQQYHPSALQLPVRVRTVRFTMPDPDVATEFKRAKALCESAVLIGGHLLERAKDELKAQNIEVNKGSIPEIIVQMLRSVEGSLEVIYVWSVLGDKNRDFYRSFIANVAEGHALINQVKAALDGEGFVCTQDISQEEMLQRQKQKRMNQLNQTRQAATALNAASQNSQVSRPAYTTNQLQEQIANGMAVQAAGDAKTTAVVDALQPQGRDAQAKVLLQKESQKQRTQQMQKRRQQQQQQHQQHQQEQMRRQQQHQILKEQIQRQGHLHPIMQRQQPTSLGRSQMPHMGRIDKNGMNIHRSAGILRNQLVSKGLGQTPNNTQISQELMASMGMHNPNLANLGTLSHSQMFPPQQLQQIQQHLRQQHLLQQRGIHGHKSPAPNSYGQETNLNAFDGQNLQSPGLPGGWSAPMGFRGSTAADGGRGVAAKPMVGANAVNAARLPHQFTTENIEAPSHLGKR